MQQVVITKQEVPKITLTTWLKDMLTQAWKRESELKSYIKYVIETNADALEIKVSAMERQTGRVREEVERWQMRNEELE